MVSKQEYIDGEISNALSRVTNQVRELEGRKSELRRKYKAQMAVLKAQIEELTTQTSNLRALGEKRKKPGIPRPLVIADNAGVKVVPILLEDTREIYKIISDEIGYFPSREFFVQFLDEFLIYRKPISAKQMEKRTHLDPQSITLHFNTAQSFLTKSSFRIIEVKQGFMLEKKD